MRVEPDPLPESPIVRLVAMSTDREADIFAGDVVGYWCSECRNADETRNQIVHGEQCPLAGRHGRQLYGSDLAPMSGNINGELRPDTTFCLLEWGVTDDELGIHNGTAVAFRCDECGNLDEHLFEILHDEVCTLAADKRVAQH